MASIRAHCCSQFPFPLCFILQAHCQTNHILASLIIIFNFKKEDLSRRQTQLQIFLVVRHSYRHCTVNGVPVLPRHQRDKITASHNQTSWQLTPTRPLPWVLATATATAMPTSISPTTAPKSIMIQTPHPPALPQSIMIRAAVLPQPMANHAAMAPATILSAILLQSPSSSSPASSGVGLQTPPQTSCQSS
ncbi:hypothetical protein B0H66DRAFT_374560 [Apodospora peruviana]|uniref:Uncharacterized protein n=1 Tax=Apodospora peruviana TaxID=516989 RepID=A0AAE0HWM2_9PEZI|nr:hypothetical protein B0H66DRAFT_374560 [Apodospora peruviana]